jgi:multiple sugar transport system substrate-binding protein
MMEKEQYEPWQQAAIGFVTQPLTAYESNPIWTADPKHTPFKFSCKNLMPNGYAGKLGTSSAACMADFIVVNMIAEAATGTSSVADAMRKAEKRAKRYYS